MKRSRINLDRAKIWMYSALTFALYPELAAAQTSVQPEAPLSILQTARSKAQSSSLNVNTIQQNTSNWANVIITIAAVIGILLAVISGYKLWSNINKGDQGRDSNVGNIIGLIVGSLMTIISIIIGIVTNWVTN